MIKVSLNNYEKEFIFSTYYKRNREKHQTLVPFNIGQCVAVYDIELDYWFRANVLEIFNEDSPDFREYLVRPKFLKFTCLLVWKLFELLKVDYIDVGKSAILKQSEIFTLDEKFVHFDPEIGIVNLSEAELNVGACVDSAKSKIQSLLNTVEQRSHAQIVCKNED
jgi:hypothetical protein